MRLVLVNHCPPALCHVCAVRLSSFAEALARAGHHVVLLTETLPGRTGDGVPDLEERLGGHDWTRPLALGVRPQGGNLARLARTGRLPTGIRQAVIAWTYLSRGGLFGDWSDAARPLAEALGRRFKPQAVWASFGNSDCWLLGQWVARAAACPWVADVKDPPSVFLPGSLRRAVLARFRDAAAFTALSSGHAGDVRRCLGREATIIHSGIDDSFLVPPPSPPAGPLSLLVVGALYDEADLAALMEGVRRHAAAAPGPLRLAYAGGEAERFTRAAAGLAGRVEVKAHAFMPLDALRREMEKAHALLYVRNPRALFQHKLFEFLALGRPILCLPDEAPEAHDLARRAGGRLIGCADAAALAGALAALPEVRPPQGLEQYTWDAQALILAEALARA
ncbi:MAG: hypothetical protein HY055_10460 [Magnetospirillum sp.]|nr:hypothetical protein [Magnetospirillum sp.]